jgi:hypothetical protein
LDDGKIYRKPWCLPSNIGLSCKFTNHPILWILGNYRNIWHNQDNSTKNAGYLLANHWETGRIPRINSGKSI